MPCTISLARLRSSRDGTDQTTKYIASTTSNSLKLEMIACGLRLMLTGWLGGFIMSSPRSINLSIYLSHFLSHSPRNKPKLLAASWYRSAALSSLARSLSCVFTLPHQNLPRRSRPHRRRHRRRHRRACCALASYGWLSCAAPHGAWRTSCSTLPAGTKPPLAHSTRTRHIAIRPWGSSRHSCGALRSNGNSPPAIRTNQPASERAREREMNT